MVDLRSRADWCSRLWIAAVCGAVWVMVSAEDVRWRWSHPLPHGNNVVDMAWSTELGWGIQVTERGQVYTSRDGQKWSPRESGTRLALRGVAFFGNRAVLTGEAGTVLYADAEDEFREGVLLNGTTDAWLEGVAASGEVAVAVGDGGVVYTTVDGVGWTGRSSGVTNWLRGVAWGGDQFVAVGEGGLVMTSPDGISWTRRMSGVATAVALNRVTPIGDGFLVVGDGGTVRFSTNGVSWVAQATEAVGDLLTGVAGGNDLLVAGDDEVRIRLGTEWGNELARAEGPMPWTYLSSVGRSNWFLLAGRTGVMMEALRSGTSSYQWTWRGSPLRPLLFEVSWVPGLFVAVGDWATVMTSLDGVEWTYEYPPLALTNATFLGVGGGSNLLVAAGSGGSLMISPNDLTDVLTTNELGQVTTQLVSTIGVVWHAVEPRPTTHDLQGVTAWNGRYYVTGDHGLILSTEDGTTWASRTGPTGEFLSGVAGFEGGLVAVGTRGAVLRSEDGEGWSMVAEGITTNWVYRVRHVGGQLVGVGQGGVILTSEDGLEWSKRDVGVGTWWTDVAWIAGRYYVVGLGGTVWTSMDTATWTDAGMITPKALFGAAADDERLVVAGTEGVILRSPVFGLSSPVRFLGYSRTLDPLEARWENLFLLSGVPDQRFTLDRQEGLGAGGWITGPRLEFFDNSGTMLYLETVGITNVPEAEFYQAEGVD
jgi:hypothetical protein